MPSPFATFCMSMGKSAKVLSKPKSSLEDKSKALMSLGSGFTDVVLPDSPLVLSDKEAAEISASASSELYDFFVKSAKTYMNSNPSPMEFSMFAAKVDPLWREISAANWVVVSDQESFRLNVALEGVTMISSQIQNVNNFSPDQARGFLEDAFTNFNNPMYLVLRNMFASQGVGVHHALKALTLLEE